MIQLSSCFQSRAYDYAGNRTSQGSQTIANLLVENSSHKFVPDEFGTGSLSQKVDRASGSAENFSYRADQKLVSYSRDGMQAEYFYDALGRRVAKRVIKGADPAFTQSYVYLGNEDKILLGKSGDGEITVYLDGQGVDEHLGEVSSRGAKAYATDHLGSVLNGEAAGAARAFGAWGENLNGSSPEISVSCPPVVYGYTGRQLDQESQTYYYRARTYLPDVGRFAQADPIGFAGGDVNLYRYVQNASISQTDPSGNGPIAAGIVAGVCSAINAYGVYSALDAVASLGKQLAAIYAQNASLREKAQTCSREDQGAIASQMAANNIAAAELAKMQAQLQLSTSVSGIGIEALCMAAGAAAFLGPTP